MSRHTLAEAQAQLPELIARARAGEEVAIVLEDGATIGLNPIRQAGRSLPPPPARGGAELLAWLDAVRVGRVVPGAPDAAELVSRMRDEGR
jgi:antitoxin (DNA-binding transcriptional repressor) of toxin-antitoxin stability system